MEKDFAMKILTVSILTFFLCLRVFAENDEEPVEEDSVALQSLVRVEEWISDETARLELARLYAQEKISWDQSIELYDILLHDKPHNTVLIVEMSRLYIQKKDFHKALSLLYPALEMHPSNETLLIEAAHAELGLSHAKKSNELLKKVLKKTEAVLLDQATVFMMVGDFYKAETIYRELLHQQPNSLDMALKLAWTLVSAQRYEEAEGLYKSLLLYCSREQTLNFDSGCSRGWNEEEKIIEALAVLKILEQDFNAALCFLNELSETPANSLLKAETYYKNDDYEQAYRLFKKLIPSRGFSVQAYIGMGKILLKWGCENDAYSSFQKAYEQDPNSIPAKFYISFSQVHEDSFIKKIIQESKSPPDLILWAQQYTENGMGGIAEFYEEALTLDPEYFPAKNGLAEALSAHYQYEEAMNIYLSILEDFPENSKTMIAIARLLSWEKNYDCALQWYDDIIALNPSSPLPQREKARVAGWAKYFFQSMEIYEELLNPTVDELLLNSVEEFMVASAWCPMLSDVTKTVYSKYEQLLNYLESPEICLDNAERKQLESILVSYLPLYRVQKAVFLEKEAKALDWDNYYIHALPVYEELVQFSPGNFEASYGYAQDFCSLGLCHCSKQIYNRLLDLDPSNNLVKLTLQENLLRSQPLLQGNYTFWTERGAGQFANSQIARHRWDQLFEYSPACNQHIRFMQSEWLEYPFFTEKYYPAEGQTIEADYLLDNFCKVYANVGYKNYFNKFSSQISCAGNIWFNRDYVNLGLGFERKNEIYNYFNLTQATQANIYWATLKGHNHYWNTEASLFHFHYNDHNDLNHANLLFSYIFTEDPTVLKLILQADYRNTAHLTEFIISPTGQLVDVIYPYWTPKNYFSEAATLEFRYNYAWFTFCEAPQRYFDIKLTGQNDTAHNPSIQLTVNWKHESMCLWGFELTTLFFRSRLWNADGIWAQIYYRF